MARRKFLPGKTHKPIKIIPTWATWEGAASKNVKVTLAPAVGYSVGPTTSATVTILGGD